MPEQTACRSSTVRAGTLGDVSLAGEPCAVVVTEDRAYVATASASHDAVSVIDLDTRAVVATFPVAFGVTALAASPDGKRVYAGRTAHDRVDITVIDVVAERVGTIDVGHGPAACLDALRVDPNGKRLYAAVTDVDGSRMIVIDAETSRVQRVVTVGSPIRDIAYAGGTVYVLTSDRAVGGAVHVIDLATDKVTDRVELGGAPTQLVMSPDHSRAYIVDYDRVSVLCTLTLDVVDFVVGRRAPVLRGAGSGRIAAVCRRLLRRCQRIRRSSRRWTCCTRSSSRPTRSRSACRGRCSRSRSDRAGIPSAPLVPGLGTARPCRSRCFG